MHLSSTGVNGYRGQTANDIKASTRIESRNSRPNLHTPSRQVNSADIIVRLSDKYIEHRRLKQPQDNDRRRMPSG